MSKSKLLLFGTGDLAQIAFEYFNADTRCEVAAFVVDREYLDKSEFCGTPVVGFDEVTSLYPPDSHAAHVCVVYGDMNRTRAATIERFRAKGYKLARYISPHAFVSPSAIIGEHAFIFENNVIQPHVTIGNNVILWSGNHVGHHSTIGNNVFISSHVVVSGHCSIGDNVFIGVNSTIPNGCIVGKESWIAYGSIVPPIVPPNSFVKSASSEFLPLNEKALARALAKVVR